MKKRFIALLCAGMMLLTACGASQPAEQQPEVQEPTQEELELAEGNYASLVFDTSDDEGKLTARYLYMTEDTKTSKGSTTTGDCSVYTSPEGKVMLVDCTNSASGYQAVEQLQRMGVEKIDILVISHPHADHIGGYQSILDAFPVEQIYMNGHEYTTATYHNMMAAIKEKDIPYEYLWAGDSFMFGDEVEVKIYNPVPEDIESISAGYQDANNCSLAMRLTYGDSSFWTSGDLYVNQEIYLVETYGDEIKSDVVKMDHHGWDTSNGRDFVQHMQATVAVGMHDSITSRTVAMRWAAAGTQTFYNCVDGAVKVSTPGDGTYDVQSQYIREIDYFGAPAEDGHYELDAAA